MGQKNGLDSYFGVHGMGSMVDMGQNFGVGDVGGVGP